MENNKTPLKPQKQSKSKAVTNKSSDASRPATLNHKCTQFLNAEQTTTTNSLLLTGSTMQSGPANSQLGIKEHSQFDGAKNTELNCSVAISGDLTGSNLIKVAALFMGGT